jgi:ubiquinone/menaquinone biosynthesis C-methylase UbiE
MKKCPKCLQYDEARFCPNCGAELFFEERFEEKAANKVNGMNNEKSKSAYNKIADYYDESPDGRFTSRFKELLLSATTLHDGQNVLDVACGNGSLLSSMNKIKPIKGHGIDVSDQMIKNAIMRNSGMEFHIAGCEEIPFPDESMNIITICASFHHFPDTNAFAKEANRVLKPQGMLYIAEIYLPVFVRMLVNPFVPLTNAGDVKIYSPKEINAIFVRFGFIQVSVQKYKHIQIVSLKKT